MKLSRLFPIFVLLVVGAIVTPYVQATEGVTLTVSYSVVDGGPKGAPAPVFHYVLNGASMSVTLTTTPTSVTADPGSLWSVPSTLGTSSNPFATERWYTFPSTGNAIRFHANLTFTYNHQYYLGLQTNNGCGKVSVDTLWPDAGQSVRIVAKPNSGCNFVSWAGTGTGSYTGTDNPAEVTMNSAITEIANFS